MDPSTATGPVSVPAAPYPLDLDPSRTALVIIDMQRDFLEPGGFGAMLGNDVSQLARTVEPLMAVLAAARAMGMAVIHTREGHRPDLTDAPPTKLARGNLSCGIGDGEAVLDKPGKGAFYATDLELILRNGGIGTLVVTGVTTEVCVHTTVREGNDRGFECLVLEDCVGSYFPEFHEVGLRMIAAQGGIFGWTTPSATFLSAIGAPAAVAS